MEPLKRIRLIKDGNTLEEFKLLQQRIIYINQIRVEVAKFYVTAVLAVFASSFLMQKFELFTLMKYSGLPLLLCGLAVVVFDAAMCGSGDATTNGMRFRLQEDEELGACGPLPSPRKLPEEFFFCFLTVVINSTVLVTWLISLFPGLKNAVEQNSINSLFALAAFSIAATLQSLMWFRISHSTFLSSTEWPSTRP
jgi:hypothetical protein